MSQKSDGAIFADSNIDSFVCSIALCEEDWHPSQCQHEALLAEVGLVVDGSVSDQAVLHVDIVLVAVSVTKQIFCSI